MNGHSGNQRYRALVNSIKAEYLSPRTRKMEKTHIAANIVSSIRNSTGRFLKLDPATNLWYEIGDKAAFRKTGQALREGSAEYRNCWMNMLAQDVGSGSTLKEVEGTARVVDADDSEQKVEAVNKTEV